MAARVVTAARVETEALVSEAVLVMMKVELVVPAQMLAMEEPAATVVAVREVGASACMWPRARALAMLSLAP